MRCDDKLLLFLSGKVEGEGGVWEVKSIIEHLDAGLSDDSQPRWCRNHRNFECAIGNLFREHSHCHRSKSLHFWTDTITPPTHESIISDQLRRRRRTWAQVRKKLKSKRKSYAESIKYFTVCSISSPALKDLNWSSVFPLTHPLTHVIRTAKLDARNIPQPISIWIIIF